MASRGRTSCSGSGTITRTRIRCSTSRYSSRDESFLIGWKGCMEPNETPIEEAPRKRRKDEEPLTWEEYQSVKGRWPTKDWNDEDQSFTTKKGTKSYARKLYYFNPLTE